MVHRQKHNEHFLTLIDHGTVPRRERMPRVLGALTVSYNSSVNWLERCFDYHYDCDPYAYNVFNTVVSYITYLRHRDISYPFFPSRRTICQFCTRITILWNCVLLILIILSTAPIFIVPSCCLKCYLSPKIFYSFFALEGRLIILLRIYSHTCYRSIYCSNFYWPCWSKYNSLSKIFYSLPSKDN